MMMESLLPSEIARLVLGYLEEQKCEDAARSFLEVCPHLQECRTVVSNGRRFSTKVSGFTLTEILEKFCAANVIIHERLNKVADCEQLKHCGDLLEQLRFLVDGSRGQRFVVNINVPTTSQASGGSPIISSSIRKRHHSGSDRDRSKRSQRLSFTTSGNNSEPVSSQLSGDAIEATPLENLPGHSGSEKMDVSMEKIMDNSQEVLGTGTCSSTVPEAPGFRSATENVRKSLDNMVESIASENANLCGQNRSNSASKLSTATDTTELTLYTHTEVQTNPYDVAESETESTYEPVENLSLLTKELLNRTELQERIAENINKAILPTDTSFREISLSESIGGEMNTSIMTELNNAIKSVVTATESDPVFAKFLDEIIGPSAGPDESPDEENDQQPFYNDGVSSKSPDSVPRETCLKTAEVCNKAITEKSETIEVPLKNRLRSSSTQQTTRSEDDRATEEKLIPNDETAAVLEDVNAAAILSIINAKNKSEEEKSATATPADLLQMEVDKEVARLEPEKEIVTTVEPDPAQTVELEKPTVPSSTQNVGKNTKKTHVRKARVVKPRVKAPATAPPPSLISEADIMAMPTLVVCSKEEMSSIMNVGSMTDDFPLPNGYCASQFLPIAPKNAEKVILPSKDEPIFLRTVNVPKNLLDVPKIGGPSQFLNPMQPLKSSHEIQMNVQTSAVPLRATTENEISIRDNNVLVEMPQMKLPEKITLYGNENSSVTVLDPSMHTLAVEEPVSVSGTGLSPFLKFNNPKESATSMPMVVDDFRVASTSKDENYDHITKRTPRSLLKSRSKNNRLSLSTPRRRSSHVRALDFGTPPKNSKPSRRMSTNESFEYSPKNKSFEKKACRTSLFKSPPSTAAAVSPKKVKSPMKIPIATRSPAPKLMGGWEKYTGVGMILGSNSPSSASCSPIKNTAAPQAVKKSWDTDLRKCLMPSEETMTTTTTTTTTTTKTKVTKKPPPKKKQVVKNSEKKKKSTPDPLMNETSNDSIPGCKPSEIHSIDMPDCTTKDQVDSDRGNVQETDKLTLETFQNKETISTFQEASKNSKLSLDHEKTIETQNTEITVKSTKKKYAKLKTITTSVTKTERGTEITSNACLTVEKIGEFSYTEKNRMQLPDMLDLETPRKYDGSFGIPPTPRLLSPGSNLTTPFTQSADEVTRVRGFVTTPEFPPTPSINLTPKQMSQDGVDKRDEQGCSEYYEPSSLPKDPRPKRSNDHSRHDMSLPLPGMMMAIAAESRVQNISVEVARGFQATSTSNNKLEITQFEVIKENLPREEAFRELKISSTDVTKNANPVEETHEISNNTSSSMDYSSDSDTSSSSDSSSTSSSSSSSSGSSNPSPTFTLNGDQTPKQISRVYTEMSNEAMKKSIGMGEQNVAENAENTPNLDDVNLRLSREENESSPTKVFSIVKTDQELEECAMETPAKDESLLSEAVISETPSTSKPIETTNLHSKISAMITEDREESQRSVKKSLPKIVSVQRILPDVSIAMKPPNSAEKLGNVAQSRNKMKSFADVSRQLEEKRLRLMAKLKEKEKPAGRTRVKRAVTVVRSKRQSAEKEKNSAHEEKEKEKSVERETQKKRKSEDRSSVQEESKERTTEKKLSKDLEKEKDVATSNLNEDKPIARKSVETQEKNTMEVDENLALEKHNKIEGTKNLKDIETVKKQPAKKSQKKNSDLENENIPKLSKEEKSSKPKIEDKKNVEVNDRKAERIKKLEKQQTENIQEDSEKNNIKLQVVENLVTNITETVQESSNQNDVPQETIENARKEKKESKDSDSKVTAKSKVDLVKRDLFSDEESNDQRATRSKTRQTTDFHKSDSLDSHPSEPSTSAENNNPAVASEDMPGVLECLDLVPNVKSDAPDEDFAILDSSQKMYHGEFHFIYDESVSTKKRKRKFSNSELEYPVEVELSDGNYQTCTRLMSATPYEEIFNLTPPRKRRTTKEVKVLQDKKKLCVPKNTKNVFKDIQEKPLATSSPVFKAANSKVAAKIPKSPKKVEPQQNDGKKKINQKIDAKSDQSTTTVKRNPKTRKRKTSDSKDSEQVEKKPRSTLPHLLLDKLDLDKFLTSVHGPA